LFAFSRRIWPLTGKWQSRASLNHLSNAWSTFSLVAVSCVYALAGKCSLRRLLWWHPFSSKLKKAYLPGCWTSALFSSFLPFLDLDN
jgi:hypothetical protein